MIIRGTIKDGKLIFPKQKLDDFVKKFSKRKSDTEVEIKITEIRQKRTLAQNNALHLYFTQLATALNDAGFDMKKTIKEGIDIPWTAMTIKEYIWRPVMETYLHKSSTTELNKQEDIDNIYDIINRTIAERTGVTVPFPSLDTLSLDQSF